MMESKVKPGEVRTSLAKHILTDGMEPLFDSEKSRGVWFVDQRDGREYLDLFTFFASSPVGFNHPHVVANKEWLGEVAVHKPTNSDIYTTVFADFVKTFAEVGIPEELPYSFYIEGGALGVENALKAAFDWKVRKNLAKGKGEKGFGVIHFVNAFHGRTGYTLSLTNTFDPRKTQYFPKFDWQRVSNPAVIFPLEENLEAVISAEGKAIEEVKTAIAANPDDVAAIIIEPIQAEGGDNHFRSEFLQELRNIADESDVMLIFDEVQTGVGLTGSFWAYQELGVTPDMISFGKKMQVCGFLAGKRIDEVEDNVFHVSSRINSTFGGNLVDMARAMLYLEAIRDEKMVENAKITGAHLLSRLQELQSEFDGVISNSRGRGLLCAFNLPSSGDRDSVIGKIEENGALILGCGERAIRFRTALNITADEIDKGIDIIRESLKAYYS